MASLLVLLAREPSEGVWMTKKGKESAFLVSGTDETGQVEAELRQKDDSVISFPLRLGLNRLDFEPFASYRVCKRANNGSMTCVEVVFNGSAHTSAHSDHRERRN